MAFELVSPYQPAGDQPRAIAELTAGFARGERYQTLLGVTGSGKTMTMAHVIAHFGRPTIVLSHNKTLAAQLYGELKAFFAKSDPLTGNVITLVDRCAIYPATHFVTQRATIERAVTAIRSELKDRLVELRAENKLVEAQRLESRTNFDVDMLLEVGRCAGIENYSRHLTGRQPGERAACLLDYFPAE